MKAHSPLNPATFGAFPRLTFLRLGEIRVEIWLRDCQLFLGNQSDTVIHRLYINLQILLLSPGNVIKWNLAMPIRMAAETREAQLNWMPPRKPSQPRGAAWGLTLRSLTSAREPARRGGETGNGLTTVGNLLQAHKRSARGIATITLVKMIPSRRMRSAWKTLIIPVRAALPVAALSGLCPNQRQALGMASGRLANRGLSPQASSAGGSVLGF